MSNDENHRNKKSIVIYFSRADENYAVGYIDKGNTEVIAEYISELTNADMFKVEPANPYSKDYDTCIQEAEERQSKHDAPITKCLPDLKNYEVIYIGSPVYWNIMPEEMVTALKEIDFNDKVIRLFVTHEGSGLGEIPEQIKNIWRGAEVLDGLTIRGALVNTSKDKVINWIKK